VDIDELLAHNRVPDEDPEPSVPLWMVTLADMLMNLLTFFVLLLSFATLDNTRYRQVVGSVQSAFSAQGKQFSTEQVEALLRNVLDQAAKQPAGEGVLPGSNAVLDLKQSQSVVQSAFEGAPPDSVQVVPTPEGVMVRVDGKLLFPSGTAELRPEATPVLDLIAKMMDRYAFDLYIMGHTDSVPIQSAKFPSNWELSAARATAALKYFSAKGAAPDRLVAVGFADSRPIADNASPEGRGRNRRVEFLFKAPQALPQGGYRPATP
jgi:chemotaxis protein MotB